LFGTVKSQNICKSEVCVVEFNAGWNKANSVDWLEKLNDCSVNHMPAKVAIAKPAPIIVFILNLNAVSSFNSFAILKNCIV